MKGRNPKRHFVLLLCLALLCGVALSIAASADDSIPVRVGIYENPPKIFTDNDGKPSGFWPDLIEYIASEELLDKGPAMEPDKKPIISGRTKWALIGIGGLAFLLLGGNLILRSRVLSKTKELRQQLTECKQAEEALQKSEAQFRGVLDASDEIIFVKDLKGRYTLANAAFSKRFKRPLEEIIGKTDAELFSKEEAKMLREIDRKVLGKGEPDTREDVLTVGGEEFIFKTTKIPLRNDAGKIVGLCGFANDITERKQAEEALRRERDLAAALEEATAALTATLDFEEVLDRILEEVGRVVPNDAANIMLIEGDEARIVRWRGYERFGAEKSVSKVVFHLSEVKNLKQMRESREPVVIPDVTTYPEWLDVPVERWLRSYAAAPIIVRGEVIGFLNVDSATPGFFTKDHAEILRAFANHAAAAIENARLYEKVQQELRERKQAEEELRGSFVQLAETVSRAMESHDPYTAGHQRRVAELARAIGEKMGLDKEQCMGLYIGGLLHDIGKISIPEEILTHPGKLTEAEWGIIRAHPRRGYEILEDTKFPWPVAEIALQHHERLNGSGYPQGLKDGEILLEARIMAVADVVEAMSSNRPYRPALGIKAALSEIEKNKGRLYDPAAVEACLSVFEEEFTFEEKNDERRA